MPGNAMRAGVLVGEIHIGGPDRAQGRGPLRVLFQKKARRRVPLRKADALDHREERGSNTRKQNDKTVTLCITQKTFELLDADDVWIAHSFETHDEMPYVGRLEVHPDTFEVPFEFARRAKEQFAFEIPDGNRPAWRVGGCLFADNAFA